MKPTPIFGTFWKFAAERQRIFWAKQEGQQPPYTADPILATYRFTNPYRVTDRISQFLLRNVIYDGQENSRSPNATLARIILFKVFNTEAAWHLIAPILAQPTPIELRLDAIDKVLTQAIADKVTFWSAAYMMHAPHGTHEPKHRPYLRLVMKMLVDGLPGKLTATESMREAVDALRSYKMVGDFIAYQWAQDLNYSPAFNFSDDYVACGPGTIRGIRKCFSDSFALDSTYDEAVAYTQSIQQAEFARLGLTFRDIGKPLGLGDIANLFCEVDKYTRVSNPTGDGKRIKQTYKPNSTPIPLMFPPKWGGFEPGMFQRVVPNVAPPLKPVPDPVTEADLNAIVAFVLDAIEKTDEPNANERWYSRIAHDEVNHFLSETMPTKYGVRLDNNNEAEVSRYYEPIYESVMNLIWEELE